MSDKTIARRYAQALFVLAREKDQIKKVGEDFGLVYGVIQENEELKKVIQHQMLDREAKKKIVSEIFGKRVSRTMLNFLLLVIDKRRERYLGEIYEEFLNYYHQALNIMYAEVQAAFDLSEPQAKSLKDKLSSITGKDVRLDKKVVPALLGGLIVKINDRVYDGSVAGRLKDLKEYLSRAETRQIGVS